ncbi:MAG: hypothetical protein RLZZ543_1268 [Bacteroidota bacterium]|jgi:flagellar capping protein FliD
MIHIGAEIEERVRRKRIKITELARIVNTNRNNIYDIFSRKTIDSGLLEKISAILEFDFFRLYSIALSKNKLIEQLIDPLEEAKEKEQLKEKVEKLEKEISVLNERLSDKETIIQIYRTTM